MFWMHFSGKKGNVAYTLVDYMYIHPTKCVNMYTVLQYDDDLWEMALKARICGDFA